MNEAIEKLQQALRSGFAPLSRDMETWKSVGINILPGKAA